MSAHHSFRQFGPLLAFLMFLSFVRTTTSTEVGDYVAHGLGYSKTLSPSNSIVSTKLRLFSNITSASSIIATANSAHNGSVDECWTSWSSFWSISSIDFSVSWFAATFKTTGESTSFYTYTRTAQQSSVRTSIETFASTSYAVDGGHTLSSTVLKSTSTYTETEKSLPQSTIVETESIALGTRVYSSRSLPPKPTCKLPRVVSQCQNQYESWITTELTPTLTPPSHCDLIAGYDYALMSFIPSLQPACAKQYSASTYSYDASMYAAKSPLCSQASIGGALCQSIRDNYIAFQDQGNAAFVPAVYMWKQAAVLFSQGTQGMLAGTGSSTVWTWPTSSTLNVPSCTLSCGRCGIVGGTVQLLYWPQGAQTAVVPYSQAPMTVDALGTTLTSPTLYISYSNMYARDGCGHLVGSTISSTILAIPTDQPLSSVWGYALPWTPIDHLAASVLTATAIFNVTDLNPPVPYSIYSSMPICATELYHDIRELGNVSTCPTTNPYNPIL